MKKILIDIVGSMLEITDLRTVPETIEDMEESVHRNTMNTLAEWLDHSKICLSCHNITLHLKIRGVDLASKPPSTPMTRIMRELKQVKTEYLRRQNAHLN